MGEDRSTTTMGNFMLKVFSTVWIAINVYFTYLKTSKWKLMTVCFCQCKIVSHSISLYETRHILDLVKTDGTVCYICQKYTRMPF